MVEYWEARLKLFGPERAFESIVAPTTDTAELEAAGVDIVIWRQLPDDDEGRSVLFYDRSQIPKTRSASADMRNNVVRYNVM